MNPRARRVLLILTVGALSSRLFVLGQQKGFALVARVGLEISVLALGCWLAHVVAHELAHLAAALMQGFQVRALQLGPLVVEVRPEKRLRVRASLSGGVNSLPIGTASLRRRLRVVAAAGPLATLVLTSAALWFVRREGLSLASGWGVFASMGLVTLVTALLPSVLLPSAPDSGTDLEQMLQPRRVLAHWFNAAALQGLFDGVRLSKLVDRREWGALLPEPRGDVEPIELGWCLVCLDAGDDAGALSRLRSMVERLGDDAPDWLITDTCNQLGCLSALQGDVVTATACLERVRQHQSAEWYCGLLEACIAKGRGEPFSLEGWKAGVERHPAKAVALAGNGWILARLSGERTTDTKP